MHRMIICGLFKVGTIFVGGNIQPVQTGNQTKVARQLSQGLDII